MNGEVLKSCRRSEAEKYLRARVVREKARRKQSLTGTLKDGQGFKGREEVGKARGGSQVPGGNAQWCLRHNEKIHNSVCMCACVCSCGG